MADSIQISYVIDPSEHSTLDLCGAYPPGGPLSSPDGAQYLVLTQRGLLRQNELEATLWLFDRREVIRSLKRGSSDQPRPRVLARFRAPGDLQVISDVRWVDSHQVAFLGQNGTPYRRLFMADLQAGSLKAMTPPDQFVSAYDIRGDTIAYTTLRFDDPVAPHAPVPEPVTGTDIYELIGAHRASVETLKENALWTTPSVLHVQSQGKEKIIPLRLFFPVLSLSPDGRYLVTIAAVADMPPAWERYRPLMEQYRLQAGSRWATARENAQRASQYILVDLASGAMRPLLNAPTGRSLGYGALTPSKALWLEDSQRVVLINTFLPVEGSQDLVERARRVQVPAVAVVDVPRRAVSPIQYLPPYQFNAASHRRLENVQWSAKDTLEFKFVTSGPGAPSDSTLEIHRLVADHLVQGAVAQGSQNGGLVLSVHEALNDPPTLMARLSNESQSSLLWNPNPQLENLALGAVSVYHWSATDGSAWSGLISLPPEYRRGTRLPLVIQTHGYEAKQFFSDGTFTTGNGGRALSARGIIVLQMDLPTMHYGSPEDGPFALSGFESAIDRLVEDGYVDRKRVGAIGFSYTCFHVLYALTHAPELFAAASITDGLNMGYVQWTMGVDAADVQQLIEQTNGGLPFSSGLSRWAEAAPGFNLDKVRAPLLISALEPGELMSEWETYAGLRRLKSPVELLWLRSGDAPHILVQPVQRLASQQGAVDWYDFWLSGHEDPSPVKSAQYKRWEGLCGLRAARDSHSVFPCVRATAH